jgi:hypothetical protein
MRGKLAGGLAAAAAFLAMTGTAHAGYAYMEMLGNDFNAIFYAGPGEAPDLTFQVADGGTSLVFEDRANPINVGRPPVDELDLNDGDLTYPEDREPCELISTHKARCIGPSDFFVWRVAIHAGDLPARVRDLDDPGQGRAIDIYTGPLGDDIEINHQQQISLHDEGGNNTVRFGTTCAFCWIWDSSVFLGPGVSTVDVRNSTLDHVSCIGVNAGQAVPHPIGRQVPAVGSLDEVFVDGFDTWDGCGNVQEP